MNSLFCCCQGLLNILPIYFRTGKFWLENVWADFDNINNLHTKNAEFSSTLSHSYRRERYTVSKYKERYTDTKRFLNEIVIFRWFGVYVNMASESPSWDSLHSWYFHLFSALLVWVLRTGYIHELFSIFVKFVVVFEAEMKIICWQV